MSCCNSFQYIDVYSNQGFCAHCRATIMKFTLDKCPKCSFETKWNFHKKTQHEAIFEPYFHYSWTSLCLVCHEKSQEWTSRDVYECVDSNQSEVDEKKKSLLEFQQKHPIVIKCRCNCPESHLNMHN